VTTGSNWPADDPRLAEVLDIVAQETGVDRERLMPDATLAVLDIASLDMVQAIFAIETRFGVEVPVVSNAGDAEFATVGDLVSHVMAAIRHGRAT
jgi:acyl carrier protein